MGSLCKLQRLYALVLELGISSVELRSYFLTEHIVLLPQLFLVHPVRVVDDHQLPEQVLPPDLAVLLVFGQQIAPALINPVFRGEGIKESIFQSPVLLL